MSKKALCIQKVDFWSKVFVPPVPTERVYPFNNNLFDLPVELIDRAICENNPRTLQLIPYILVIHPYGNEFYQYTRGVAGGEDRLHAKLSIGLGGHIDREPEYSESLDYVVRDEAARELKEELGLLDVRWTEIDVRGFVYEEVTEVGKVHLGILCTYQLTRQELTQLTLEENQITEGRWSSLQHLQTPEVYSRLELWSQAVVDWIAKIEAQYQSN